MNNEERVLRTIARKEIDYLPSQIEFSNKEKMKEVATALGMASVEELKEYLGNHIHFTYHWDDMAGIFRNNYSLMKKTEELGYAVVDEKRNRVYDRWGMCYDMNADGFFNLCHPLKGINKESVKRFKVPELNDRPDFLSYAEEELKQYSGQYLVICAGYNGIFEKAYNLVGFEEFMYNMAVSPLIIEELLDKITEYKIEAAKRIVKAGFKVGHYGDDLGTQQGAFFSKEMFRRFFKPRIAKVWEIFKNAGMPVQMHSCGNILDFIPDLIEIGLDVLEPVQPVMDIKYLKKEYGKYLVFYGGIDTQTYITFGSPEDVRRETENTIRILGEGGGYIIAPSQDIMPNTPIQNIVSLIETIKENRQK